MNSDQDKKQLENVLSKRSVVINEGTFLLKIDSLDVNDVDFQKLCLYGDAFPSAYSPHVSMIPTGIFLPQMFSGKNVFFEYKVGGTKSPMLDSFLPFAFMIHDAGHKAIKRMYDKLFNSKNNKSYSDIYPEMVQSLLAHLSGDKTKLSVFGDSKWPIPEKSVDETTQRLLDENQDSVIVVMFTYASAIKILETDPSNLKFGSQTENSFVSIPNNVVAKFLGYTIGKSHEMILSEGVTKALKRELLTLVQLFVGFEKRPSGNIEDYIQNTSLLFSNQLKSIRCEVDENVESYCLAALKLCISRNLEMEEINTTSAILKDSDHVETIKKKILFELLMILDMGSCFNTRNLTKKELSEGKPTIMCTEAYTNPFNELCKAMYGNISWLAHLLTETLFFSRIRCRSQDCQTCQQKICAHNAPSLMFNFTTKAASTKKDRTAAVACFFTSNCYNRTGPMGNMRSKETSFGADVNNFIVWEKHHRSLLKSLLDSYTLDLSSLVDQTPTTEDNIDERAEQIMDWISSQLDNALQTCEQFCEQLNDGSDSVNHVSNVESEIRNVYRLASMYDRGFTNVMLSESLQFLLRSLILFEQPTFQNQSVNEVFLKVRPLLLDNKSGFTMTLTQSMKTISIPKIAVKSYTSDDMEINIQSTLSENYQINELISQASYKCKTYLYGRYDEKKGNGSNRKQNFVQNMAGRKIGSGVSLAMLNNSFLHFKNFCAKEACRVLGIADNDYCRDVLNEIRDETLDKYSHLFQYASQYKADDWSSVLLLISVLKMLEHLAIQPSYGKISFLTFNKLSKNLPIDNFSFEQNLSDEEFDSRECMYAMNCSMIEFLAVIQGNKLPFKKCSGKHLDSSNELLNSFSVSKMHPGPPVYYLAFGEKSNRFKEASNNLLTTFLNTEQFKLEKDAAFTSYIKAHKKQIFDCVFETTFAEQGNYIENRHTTEVLDEMLSEFDENFPPSVFASEQIRSFMKLVLQEYLKADQSAVDLMAKRIKEVNARVKNRKRRRGETSDAHEEECLLPENQINQRDEDDDAENQFLAKRPKLGH